MRCRHTSVGWGGFSVYRKYSVFRFRRKSKTEKNEKPEKIGKTEKRHVLILNLSCIGFRTLKSFYTLTLKCRNLTARFGSFFKKAGEDSATCQTCLRQVKNKDGNTSILAMHMRRNHPMQYATMNPQKRKLDHQD